ncbi:MAG: DUF1549 and DUF1553 domain-containing protein [Gemmataceae bacterium]
MGAALRMCPRCHSPLPPSPGASQVQCGHCGQRVRLANPAHPTPPPPPRTAAHAPPPAPAQPVAAPAVAASGPVLVSHTYLRASHRKSRHLLAIAVILVLFLGLIGTVLAMASRPDADGSGGFLSRFSLDALFGTRPDNDEAAKQRLADKAFGERLNEEGKGGYRPQSFAPVASPATLSADAALEKATRDIYQSAAPSRTAPPQEGSTRIDELVFGKLKEKGITPAALCSDAAFLRRVYLDLTGTIPTAAEARAFLADKSPDKRSKLIDQLLERNDYADYWSMRWCDLLRVKSEFPINLWPNAVQAYHKWLRTAIRDNMPFDQFARTLLTSSGSNFRDPPVNFYRAIQGRAPVNMAQAVALTFMGVRPEGFPKEKWDGMTPFFSQLSYKKTIEWKEEVVLHDPQKPIKVEEAVFPDGTKPANLSGIDPRLVFADWLITPSNPWFNRNIANRAWSWLVGRGIIHEPDDIRPNNPPSHPELLAHLEKELVAVKYDMKQFFRLILNSRTYQLSAIPASTHPEAAALFASYPVRRLEAEVIIDAICQITGTTEKYFSPIPEPFTYIPETYRSITLADASITSPFLELFGRPPRDSGLESERNNNFTAGQRLHMLNSSHIAKKLEEGPKLRSLLAANPKPEQLVEELYLTILSRLPSEDEMGTASSYAQTGMWGRRPGVDLAWALINSSDFLCRH